MLIEIDGKPLFKITESHKNILRNDLHSEILEEDLKRRIKWAIEHKIAQSYERLRKEWIPILEKDKNVNSIPINREEFVSLILSRADYKNRSKREEENLI